MAAEVRLADSVTALGPEHRGCILVSGSHGGVVAARYALAAGVRAAIFNDAGGGLDEAGIAGLEWLRARGVAAVTLSHTSARIADARQALERGVVSHVNAVAAALGVTVGASCREAVARMADAPLPGSAPAPPVQGRHTLDRARGVVGLDSVGLVRARDAGLVLVIGSHCELHGGDPASALPVDARAAFFHDAGLGELADACTRLSVLAARSIPAAAVSCRSARIGDARSMWESGVLSAVNAPAAALGWERGTTVRGAVARLHP